MFMHNGEEIPIPKPLRLELGVGDNIIIRCNNVHLPLIVKYSFERLEKGVMLKYISNMNDSDIGELSYLFSTLKLIRYTEHLMFLVLLNKDLGI